MDYNPSMITIAEVPEYIRQAEKLMSAAERQDILSYLAAHPKSGDLYRGRGWDSQVALGPGRPGQERRGTGHLLFPQRDDATLPADFVRQE